MTENGCIPILDVIPSVSCRPSGECPCCLDGRRILSSKLYEHLSEIDTCCSDRMDRMIHQMAETEGVNEKLKASDQLGWISRMNSIRHRVEEIVLDELVFD